MAFFRSAYWLALIIPSTLLGGALISEYGFGLYPCEMCIWQRWPHLVAILLALLGIMFNQIRGAQLMIVAAALAIMTSGLIGGFHAGVEYGWWEGITSCSTTIDSGGDMLETIMNAPLIRCDVAPWSLFGISLAGFNFIFSVGGALIVLAKLLNDKRKA